MHWEWTLTSPRLEAVIYFLLHNTCSFDLSLNRTKSKAFGVSCSYFLNSSIVFFTFFLRADAAVLGPINMHLLPHLPFSTYTPDKYSSVLTMMTLSHTLRTVFWPCLSLSLTSPALIPGSYLSHAAVSTCVISLRIVPCMLTVVLAASSLHLCFSCIFFCPFLLKEKVSCTTSFLLMWSLPLYSPLCPLPVPLKVKWNFCSFLPNSRILILCIFTVQRNRSYTSVLRSVLYSTNPRMIPRTLVLWTFLTWVG